MTTAHASTIVQHAPGRQPAASTGHIRALHEPPTMSLRGDAIVANRGLLRVEEAAQWLGVGRTKAYELVQRGTIPSVTIGKSRRILVSALEAFVEQLAEDGSVA